MSFQPQRFFSLSSSTTSHPGETATSAQTAEQAPAPSFTSIHHRRTNLDLLVRAASGKKYNNSMNNDNSIINNNMSAPATDNNNNSPALTQESNSNNNNNTQQNNLQQVFLQTMAANSAAAAQAQGMNNNNQQQQNNPNLNQQQQQQHQFGQLFNNMAQQGGIQHQQLQQQQGNNNNGTPNPQAQQQQQLQQQVQAQQDQQGISISQLVASLQAQQQAQQQAQVQAALARAFGPGSTTNQGSGGLAGAHQQGGLGLVGGLQGLQGGTPMSAAGGLQGLMSQAGLTTNLNSVFGQPKTAARDLLSRMQLATQGVQQQQQQPQQGSISAAAQQQNQAQVQQQQQQNTTNQSPAVGGNANGAASNATADDLIRLQQEQENHNKMLQMVANDRQERAMLANQEEIIKKMKKDQQQQQQGSGNNDGTNGIQMNDAVSNIYNQVAANNNTIFGQQTASLLNNSLLSNNGLNVSQQLAAAKSPQVGLMNSQVQSFGGTPSASSVAAQLQSNLIAAAAAGGMSNLAASLGAAVGGDGLGGGIVPSNDGQHLHQKLSTARGAAIVPCRARGMPVDHNFKTAYFVIPDGIEHGDELMCSYPGCRQAGVKFRYCLHCRVPVAKRNFRNRHRHGVPGADETSDFDMEEESEEEETPSNSLLKNGDNICQPVDGGTEQDEDYAGVKKEHVLIIPGADATGTTMKKKKKRKSQRVPCRARGMPMAHNFKTAYFIIPPTIEHGDELLCSFPSCRSAGAKFRYCLHCKVPVAKRNFRNRHKHGNLGGLDKKKGNLKSPESPGDLDKKKKAGEESNNNKTDGGEGKSAEVDAAEEGKVTVASTQDANKVQKWVELLENKPDAGDKPAMAIWMLNLMNATEGGGAPPAAGVKMEPPDDDKGVEPSAAAQAEELIAKEETAPTTSESMGEEEGSANSSSENGRKREAEDGDSNSNGVPPKKMFKNNFEEV